MAVDTRERILIAATEAFVAPDAGGPALRAIARAGGVNSALIHYHFGSRAGLYEAALLRALTPIQARRDVALEALRNGGSADGTDLARLCVVPLREAAALHPAPGDAAAALRLLARATAESAERLETLTLRHFAPSLFALRDVLSRALPALGPDTKRRRFEIAVRTALVTLASGPVSEDATAPLERFLAAGLDGPE